MRRLNVSNCKPGMIVGRPIFYNGTVILLEKGTMLTQTYIGKLEELGISEIYIEDDISKDIVVSDIIKDETRREAISFVRNAMESYGATTNIYSKEVMRIVNKIIDDILSNENVIVNIMDIKNCDDYTFLHCVNVGILSIITGLKLGMSNRELKDLGVGALLHDIGKVMIPEQILKKNASLTDYEYEIIKLHSLYGYQILKQIPDISEESSKVALNHHERFDGKGYPNGLKNKDIHVFSRIVAITDIFDALTSDRIYRKKISTNQAVDYLTLVAVPSLDAFVLSTFVRIIPPYAVGTCVILSNGEKGIVLRVNEMFPTRPVVRVVFNADGTKKPMFEEVDLSVQTGIQIINTVELP
jgi:HD-GYP domain-containing protein (c-di-GMP phosphodiesterase class II)